MMCKKQLPAGIAFDKIVYDGDAGDSDEDGVL
jgi:hypothetical protein